MTLTIDVQGATVEFLTPLDEEPCVMRGSMRPGDVFNVPGDRKHGWRNVGSVPAEMIVVTTAKIARFFREVAEATPEEFLAISERYGYWNDPEPLSR